MKSTILAVDPKISTCPAFVLTGPVPPIWSPPVRYWFPTIEKVATGDDVPIPTNPDPVANVAPPANVEVAVVVANSAASEGVDVPTILVPSNTRSAEDESVELFVPPFAIGSTPVTCVVRLICPASVENERQVFPMA
jgi:hypothetical protein